MVTVGDSCLHKICFVDSLAGERNERKIMVTVSICVSDLITQVGSRLGMRRDPCTACGLPVFLAEKLLIARAPYHRTCFRCARCGNQLTPGNYYETEKGQYCCETCPDEEISASVRCKYAESTTMSDAKRERSSEPSRPLSDEEKTERKVRFFCFFFFLTTKNFFFPLRFGISIKQNLSYAGCAESLG